MTGPEQGPVWPGPGPQPPTWPAPPPQPKPERPPRPSDVVLSVQLWIFVIATFTVSMIAQIVANKGSEAVRAQYERDIQGEGPGQKMMREQFPTFESFDNAIFGVALFAVITGAIVTGVLVYLMWRGQSWARVALQLVGAFILVQGVFAFFSDQALIAVPAILAAIAMVGALITSNSREAMEYFKPGFASRTRR
ncbi:hypothetical protein [Tsukamurella sp. 1534]|uniref:hypothetical protein n=1 Tax=Tsukamurella sp. 1534 TaxID=1151061 RepID=UPI0002F2ED1C|nr:hypothetical protein [Tsukamurella sp. 1534]